MNTSQKITYRPAWASYWKSWIATFGILGAFALSTNIRQEISAPSKDIPLLPWVVLIPIGLIVARILIHRYSRTYQIEQSRRIRNTTGIISRVRREFLISDKIQTDLKQSIIGRLLNYGTLRFWTGDEQSGFAWMNVHDPARRETEVKQLATSELSAAAAENGPVVSEAPDKRAFQPDAEVSKIEVPPLGAEFADHIVIMPPFPGIIITVATEPKYISSTATKERDHRFIERGEPLIAIEIPYRNLAFSGKKYEKVTIPSPVTGLVISHAYELTKETYDHKHKYDSELDPSHLMLTSILPIKNETTPDKGQVIFRDLRAALWTHRSFLFRDQKRAKHPAKARYLTDFQTDEGVRAMLDELSNQACDIADAKKYYHEYINEIWFKRPDLRLFLRHLVDENGLRNFLAIWKTVPLNQNVEAALRALRDEAPSTE